jgi:hypothetical protein
MEDYRELRYGHLQLVQFTSVNSNWYELSCLYSDFKTECRFLVLTI